MARIESEKQLHDAMVLYFTDNESDIRNDHRRRQFL